MISQSPVFLLNSCHPLDCAPPESLRSPRASLFRSYGGKLPSSFNVILSSALVCSTCPPVSVSGTVLTQGLFPGTSSKPIQSNKDERLKRSVTACWLTNINVIPIDYAFRPRLRDRLTLRRLTLRRNPWTFGDTVFHSVCRYSCQHSHFRSLQDASRLSLRRQTERSATVVGGQKTDDRDRTNLTTAQQEPAAVGISSDTRRANAARFLRRHSRDRARSAPKPASRPTNRSPSRRSA